MTERTRKIIEAGWERYSGGLSWPVNGQELEDGWYVPNRGKDSLKTMLDAIDALVNEKAKL